VLGLLPFLGCGSEKTHAVFREGNAGCQSLPNGEILFVPVGGGSPVAGRIKEGLFELRSRPGTMRVEIRSAADTVPTKEQMQQIGRSGIDERRIPARYNSTTTLSVEVPSPDGKKPI